MNKREREYLISIKKMMESLGEPTEVLNNKLKEAIAEGVKNKEINKSDVEEIKTLWDLNPEIEKEIEKEMGMEKEHLIDEGQRIIPPIELIEPIEDVLTRLKFGQSRTKQLLIDKWIKEIKDEDTVAHYYNTLTRVLEEAIVGINSFKGYTKNVVKHNKIHKLLTILQTETKAL